MFNTLKSRFIQGHRTVHFPHQPPELPERMIGYPQLDHAKCTRCGLCAKQCPTGAITIQNRMLFYDLGRCIFCGKCAYSCKNHALAITKEYRMGGFLREDLVVDPAQPFELRKPHNAMLQDMYENSLKLYHVSCGGCGACELDCDAMNSSIWDMGRFGMQFVTSPRHADVLLITGPVTKNMRNALEKTHRSMPLPRCVIACGACVISGGIYRESPEAFSGLDDVLKVDAFIPGCPPHPAILLDTILRLTGKIKSSNFGE